MGIPLLDSLLGNAAQAASPARAQPKWLALTRRAAAQALERDGLPGARNEAWKYTSLRALEQRQYTNGDAAAQTRAVDANLFALPDVVGPRLVFVNGVFRADLSDTRRVDGLTMTTLDALSPDAVDAVRNSLGREYRDSAEAFARLNTALAHDGPVLRVSAGAQIAPPVHIVFAGAAAAQDLAWQARAFVEVGEGASLRLLEHHIAAGANAHLGNLVAQYVLHADARLDLVQVQEAAETATLIRRSEFSVGNAAVLLLHTIETGAQMTRHDITVDLASKGARFDSRGVFALHGRQHADTHLDVRHNARDTACDVAWRGVADQRARGVFHGAITVAPGADGADARLSNKNLLLSTQAEIDTQPVLEIYADEVKAAHGATVGQLDQNAMFYLRSRGIAEVDARGLLISAFCRETLDGIDNKELREHLARRVLAHLPQGGGGVDG